MVTDGLTLWVTGCDIMMVERNEKGRKHQVIAQMFTDTAEFPKNNFNIKFDFLGD